MAHTTKSLYLTLLQVTLGPFASTTTWCYTHGSLAQIRTTIHGQRPTQATRHIYYHTLTLYYPKRLLQTDQVRIIIIINPHAPNHGTSIFSKYGNYLPWQSTKRNAHYYNHFTPNTSYFHEVTAIPTEPNRKIVTASHYCAPFNLQIPARPNPWIFAPLAVPQYASTQVPSPAYPTTKTIL